VAIRDPRGRLFGAAERVLLRDGPAALTSRAVTDEAGVAKGVLHRHFADFDEFLAELAIDRIARVNAQAAALRAAAGTGTVAGNLAAALPELFTPPLLALARLVFARDELRARLRASTGSRLPVMSECVALAARYLEAERDLGRIAPGADLATLAPMLVSAVHMLFTDTDGPPPGQADVTRVVTAALATAGSRLPAARLPGCPPLADTAALLPGRRAGWQERWVIRHCCHGRSPGRLGPCARC
jgi:AcrR family transcriptional regulator